MTPAIWAAVFFVWLLGAVATNAAQRVIGEANPRTIGDSFSGDDGIDLFLIAIWPVFWPCFIIHLMARRASGWVIG